MRLNEKMNEWSLKQDIRVQEILITELRKKYDEQLQLSVDRSEGAANVAFSQAQLARVEKTLDQIDDRILATQSEQRAPGRITPLSQAVSSEPNPMKRFMIVVVGAIVVFFLTLILGGVLCSRGGRKRCCLQG